MPVAGAVAARRPPAEAAAAPGWREGDGGARHHTVKSPLVIPRDQDNVVLTIERKEVRLTNLRKVFWPELGLTKGDLLQYYADVAGGAAAALREPRDGDEALSARRRRRVLLHEARADAAAGVDPDLLDRPRLQRRHRLPDDSGSRGAAVGHQPRLHRSEPVVRALRRRRSAGLPAFRPRSRRWAPRSIACARPR